MTADVIVAGAGPAGSATALALARAGIDVAIVERSRFPRRKVCGEYLNSGALAALARLGLDVRVLEGGAALRGIRLVTGGAPPVELRFSKPAVAIAREAFDAMLLDAAVAAGARVVRGRVEDLIFAGARAAGTVVRDEAGDLHELRAKFIVGADGIGSVVARKLDLLRPAPGGRYALGGHYAGFGDLDGFIEMYAGAGAYFAVNPLAGELANVMVVVRKAALAAWAGSVDAGMSGKAAELGRGHRSFAGAQRVGPRVSIGPLAHAVRARTAPGALLAGDAAGFLNPFTGQGVFLALLAAERAAGALLATFAHAGDETVAMRAYERALRADLAIRSRLAGFVDLLVDVPFLARRAADRLRRRPRVAGVLLGALAGTSPPQSALHPAILSGLLA